MLSICNRVIWSLEIIKNKNKQMAHKHLAQQKKIHGKSQDFQTLEIFRPAYLFKNLSNFPTNVAHSNSAKTKKLTMSND